MLNFVRIKRVHQNNMQKKQYLGFTWTFGVIYCTEVLQGATNEDTLHTNLTQMCHLSQDKQEYKSHTAVNDRKEDTVAFLTQCAEIFQLLTKVSHCADQVVGAQQKTTQQSPSWAWPEICNTMTWHPTVTQMVFVRQLDPQEGQVVISFLKHLQASCFLFHLGINCKDGSAQITAMSFNCVRKFERQKWLPEKFHAQRTHGMHGHGKNPIKLLDREKYSKVTYEYTRTRKVFRTFF